MQKVTFLRGMNLNVPDPRTRAFFQPGDTVALPEEMALRLINGGLAKSAGPTVSRPAPAMPREAGMEITARPAVAEATRTVPGDWRSLSWQAKRSLAASLTDEPIRNMEVAERVIAAHASRQA